MKPDNDITHQGVNLFGSDKCFIDLNEFQMFHITFKDISPTLSVQFWYKDRCTRYMSRNDKFILWNCISAVENAIYRSFQNRTLLFIIMD